MKFGACLYVGKTPLYFTFLSSMLTSVFVKIKKEGNKFIDNFNIDLSAFYEDNDVDSLKFLFW